MTVCVSSSTHQMITLPERVVDTVNGNNKPWVTNKNKRVDYGIAMLVQ